jgi:hypothetical protein
MAVDEQWQSKDGWQWHGEWQWQGGSGTSRFVGSVRFEWYQTQCGSGSIGRVAVVLDNIIKWQWVAIKGWVAVAWGVAVAGWQWHQSMREISAVRTVVVGAWQWQYWQGCGGLDNIIKWQWMMSKMAVCVSGSGRVAVAPEVQCSFNGCGRGTDWQKKCGHFVKKKQKVAVAVVAMVWQWQ